MSERPDGGYSIERGARRAARRRRQRRRRGLVVVAVVALAAASAGAVALLGRSSSPGDRTTAARPQDGEQNAEQGGTSSSTPATQATTTLPDLPAIPAPVAGTAKVISEGPQASGGFAFTFDDGTCATCTRDLVAAIERTGAHATLCPNGSMAASWEPLASQVKRLVQRGQVVLCNHTFAHPELNKVSAERIRSELLRNEEWIQATFGVTSRPFLRPPYGAYNSTVLRVAGELGWTKVVMWSGTLSDSTLQTDQWELDATTKALQPGTIMLGHANHPTTPRIFDQLVALVEGAGLRTMHLGELLGTESGFGGWPGPQPGWSPTTATTAAMPSSTASRSNVSDRSAATAPGPPPSSPSGRSGAEASPAPGSSVTTSRRSTG